MAAALARVLRGGRSGAYSALIPAVCRRGLQEGVAPLVPGSSQASIAAGMARLMHTGQWRNSVPQQKALPFRTPFRGVLSQEQKLVRMEQFGSKRSFNNPFSPGPADGLPWPLLGITGAISMAYSVSFLVLSLWESYTEEDEYSVSLVDGKKT